MQGIDNFTGVPLSKMTNAGRLLLGATLMFLAPVLYWGLPS